MRLTEEDVLIVARLAANYVELAINIGSRHPKDSEQAANYINAIQLEILSHFDDDFGPKIIDAIREYGDIKGDYGNYKQEIKVTSNKKSVKEGITNCHRIKNPLRKHKIEKMI